MKVTRRQFSGSVLGGTLVGSSTLNAQPTDVVVVGVEHGDIVRNRGADKDPNPSEMEDYTRLPASTTPASAFQAVVVRFVNLRTHQSTSSVVNEGLLSPSDRISGVTYLADGSLLVAINRDSASADGAAPTRLVTLNQTPRTVFVSGLAQDQALDSLLLLKNRSLIGMVTKKDGTGPAHLVDVNPTTGAVTFTKRVSLPTDRRFSCLAEAADGTLYTSVFRANATTELWTLDLTRKTAAFSMKLTTFDGMAGPVPWYHGIQSLVVTPAGQLTALANLEYRLPDTVYTIDLHTGFMKEVVGFPVSRAALATVKI